MTWRWFRIVWLWSACMLGGLNVAGDNQPIAHSGQEIRVIIEYPVPETTDGLQLRIALLDDSTEVFARITDLQEQSKGKLEPLVRRYMHAAEILTRLPTSEQKTQALQQFSNAERQIDDLLLIYRQQIESVLERATLKFQTTSTLSDTVSFFGIPPGNYRVYAELIFSTTTLRWFEAISVKGGDDGSVELTRDNLKNPYWTDLNWWSFMNLDFRKHH